MGIRFSCPNGHKLHVKDYLAGKRAVCPDCGAKIIVPPADTVAETLTQQAVVGIAPAAASNDLPTAGLPTNAEPVATEWPAVGVGSQSIVIPTFEPETPPSSLAPPPALSFPETIVDAPLPPADVLPSAEFLPPPDVTPLVAARPKRAHSGSHKPLILAMVLTAILIVLVFVLVWVLMHGPDAQSPPPGEPAAAVLHLTSDGEIAVA